jgi:hypothetical protein
MTPFLDLKSIQLTQRSEILVAVECAIESG